MEAWKWARGFSLAILLLATIALSRAAAHGGESAANGTEGLGPSESVPEMGKAYEPAAAQGEKFSLVSAMPSLIPVDDYRGDLWKRQAMTGDWAVTRTKLLENGIVFDVELTQILQYNAYGGKSTNNGLQYSGSVDYYAYADTGRLGLWPGGLWKLHGQTEFGRSVNRKVGAVVPVNYQALLPVPNDPGETTLSELYLMQALSKYLLMAAGKLDLSSFGDTNVFANNQKTQFLNTGLRNNPVLFPFAPYTMLGAFLGIMPLGTDDWIIGPFIGDTNSSATQSGFNTWFHSPRGTTLGGEMDVKIKPLKLPGNIRLGGAWSNKRFTNLAQDRRQLLEDITSGLQPEKVSGSFAIYGNFDQYLYLKDEQTEQGFGCFGRLGFAPKDRNAVNWFFSLGIGGKGMVPRRSDDTFGIGYYFADISNELTKGPILPSLKPEQGVELYYNIEITPWLRITPDLQFIVNPAAASAVRSAADSDFSLVLGSRMQMSF